MHSLTVSEGSYRARGIASANAVVESDVPTWMPELLIETATRHITSPAPIKQRVERCLADFKKSHQDSWHEDQKAFTSDQLLSLNDLLIGSTYCEFPGCFVDGSLLASDGIAQWSNDISSQQMPETRVNTRNRAN